MPQDNQDLFNVMDSALKRQGEGRSQRFRSPGEERPARGDQPKPPSQRAVPEQPAQPSAPAQSPAAEATIRIPEYQRTEGQPNTRQITQRLYPMPDSARTLPGSGGLSPGQVLRGTVFSGNRFRPQPGQQQPPAGANAPDPEPPVEEVAPPPPSPPPATAVQQVQAAPSTRQSPVRGIASGTLRSRPSSLLTPSVRPSGVLTPQAPAPAASNRYDAPAAPAQAGGFHVRTEVASVALVCTVVALVGAFLLGHRMGESNAQRQNAGDKPVVEKPRPVSTVPPAVPDLGSPSPPATPIQSPVLPAPETPKPVASAPVQPASAATGRYTLRVRSYNDKNTADRLAAQLRSKGIPEARVLSQSGVYKVLVGRFPAKNDPGIEELRRKVLGFSEWKSFRPDVVQE